MCADTLNHTKLSCVRCNVSCLSHMCACCVCLCPAAGKDVLAELLQEHPLWTTRALEAALRVDSNVQ